MVGREFVVEDDVGPAQHAAGGDATEGAGQLQRGYLDCALADADGDGLAGVPLVVLRLHLPGLAGHHAGGLVGQVDAGLDADADLVAVTGDGVDAEPVSQRVVEGVAGIRQRVVDVDRAVVLVAGEEAAVEGGAAVALDMHVLRDAFFQTGQGHDDFEG